MNLKQGISLTINKTNLRFINDYAKKQKMTKSEIVDQLIEMYRKHKLKSGIIAGFKNQNKKELTEAMSDFSDYLKITDNN